MDNKRKEMNAKLPDNAQEIILSTISCGVFTVDNNWQITSFNKAMTEITGIPERDALGRSCKEVLRGDICHGNCALRETIKTGNRIKDKPFELIDAQGVIKPVCISTAVFKAKDGTLLGGLETVRDLSVVTELRKTINKSYRLNDIVSRNHEMGRIFELLPKIAVTMSTVLIEGESGTGKELIARAVHSLSDRNRGPFIALNCAALPDSLLESELFGYRKGAFTDAKFDKKGRVDLAHGGTLFLDEIGDISSAFQAKLLRFLQDHTYEPLGSQRQYMSDVRVIAATNKNLSQQVKEGLFRDDLFFRLHVVKIELPPLRSRLEDIPLLIESFIRRFNAIQNKTITSFSQDALSIMMGYDYPGNIRELENIIEYAFILCDGTRILPQHLPVWLTGQGNDLKSGRFDPQIELKRLETSLIMKTLIQHDNNCEETARSLGIHKTTLYRKLKKLGIPAPVRKRN
jgi:PAS domain S-box-containing protein